MQAVGELYPAVPPPRLCDVVETEAATGRKFSRHVVAHVPGYAFLSNREVGLLLEHLLTYPEAADLAVWGADGEATFVVDRSVYSRYGGGGV